MAAQLLGRRQGAVELGGGEDEEGEDGERMGDDAGGWDDDDGERIPWEDKGKGPAVDFGDQFDDDDQGDDQEGAEAGLGYEGFSDDEAPVCVLCSLPSSLFFFLLFL